MLSSNVRVAVIRMTEVMHAKLIASPSALPEPAFGIADSVNNEWQQRRPYLGVFTYETRRSAEHVVGIGVAIPGKMSADYERRVAVSDFTAAKPPVSIGRLRRRLGRKYEHAVNAGPAASDESAQQLITALRTVAPHLAQPLDALIETLGRHVADSETMTVRTHEKDGVNLLLRANGFDYGPLLRASGMISPDRPYLAAVPRENAISTHDWLHFEDFISHDPPVNLPGVLIHTSPIVEARAYGKGPQQLVIYNANTSRLDDVKGVDLMYYNATDQSFVMVQYKDFAVDDDDSRKVIRPDARLYDQLRRMRELDDQCKPSSDPMDIRLHPKPCFLKLCDPGDVGSDSVDMIKGIYLTREHFEAVLHSPDARGPRGGRVIGKMTAPRHLDNDTFTTLLRYGWIGSCGVGTDLVREQVWNSLSQRGSVVIGAHLGNWPLGNGYGRKRAASAQQ
jgi:hypothetical protein